MHGDLFVESIVLLFFSTFYFVNGSGHTIVLYAADEIA